MLCDGTEKISMNANMIHCKLQKISVIYMLLLRDVLVRFFFTLLSQAQKDDCVFKAPPPTLKCQFWSDFLLF